MKINHIWAVYFSPTGGTQKAVTAVAECLSKELQIEYSELDITSKASRETAYEFEKEDLLIIGSPVYAGRLPNKIMPDYEKCLLGHQTLALPVCVYGNRSYGDSLTELRAILENNEFRVIGGAALVSEHAFSNKLAIGRPDQNDLKEIADFTARIAVNIRENDMVSPIVLLEEEKVGPYYTPLQEDGTPAKFLPAKPVTDLEKCTRCGECAKVCPMESIDAKDVELVNGICIKCQACVKICPTGAKCFTDEQFLSHVRMLEKNYVRRAENFFIG